MVYFCCANGANIVRIENLVLRKIHEPKRNQMTVEWRTLHTEELNRLYDLHNVRNNEISTTKMGLVGHVAGTGER